MHKTNNCSRTNSYIFINNGSDYITKLRRLKIQEGILSSNVNKTYDEYLEKNNDNNKHKNNKDFKKYLCKLRDSYTDMKNLYEDIKVKTNCNEIAEVTDINDIKRDILELEQKIKSFKQFLSKELNIMQIQETALMEKTNDNRFEEKKYAGHPKSQTKKFKEIVHSPVRVLIKSPFKCFETQQFQEFMKTSSNRYGGWNEYNNNLFIQIWNKYNGDVVFTLKPVENTRLLQEFKNEVLLRISGVNAEDISSHTEWYAQYVYLKMCQKRALDQWKENRRKIKKPIREGKTIQSINTISGDDGSHVVNTNGSKLVNPKVKWNVESNVVDVPRTLNVSRLMRPTKQWINRCLKDEKMPSFESDIENISKLRVPAWRFRLELT